jgi:ATP-binding cassette subfamily B protein
MWRTLGRFFRGYKGFYRWIFLSQVLLFATCIAILLVPFQTQTLINDGVLKGDMGVILDVAVNCLLLLALAAAFNIANSWIAVNLAEGTARHFRTSLYSRIQTFSFGNIDRFQVSDLNVRLTSDVGNIRIAVLQAMMQLLRSPFMLLCCLGLAYITAPSQVWIMWLLLPVVVVLVSFYLVLASRYYRDRQKRLDEVNSVLQEDMAGVRVVKAFVRQDYENQRYDRVNTNLKGAALKPVLLASFYQPTTQFLISVGIFLNVASGGYLLLSGDPTISLGQLFAFFQYLNMSIMPLVTLTAVLPNIAAATASLERAYEVLDTDADVQDAGAARPLDLAQVKGRVAFENVSFGFVAEDGKPGPLVLKDINLVAEPGQTVAFLGATGSGKSALVNLIPRFYDVTAGRITLDGVDIRELRQEDLRVMVGVCLQESILFTGDLRQNIKLGRPEANDDEMVAAAKAADADSFVQRIPEGYDGRVARRGANFSGGQRQRLSIARALNVRPKVLILDDSTSAVDLATEARIQEAIKGMMAETTQFVVAQRISSVLTADTIVLLDGGKQVGVGTHQELLATSALYRDIAASQLGKEVLEPVAGGAA